MDNNLENIRKRLEEIELIIKENPNLAFEYKNEVIKIAEELLNSSPKFDEAD